MKEWKDNTAYRQNQKIKLPTSWMLKTEEFQITITSNHVYTKGRWVLHCKELNMDCIDLGYDVNTDLKIVQKYAIRTVKNKLDKLYDSILSCL